MKKISYISPVVCICDETGFNWTTRDSVKNFDSYQKIGISSAGIEWFIPVGSGLKKYATEKLKQLESVYDEI